MPRAEAPTLSPGDWADLRDQMTPYEQAVLDSGQTPTTLGGKPLMAETAGVAARSPGPLPLNWGEPQVPFVSDGSPAAAPVGGTPPASTNYLQIVPGSEDTSPAAREAAWRRLNPSAPGAVAPAAGPLPLNWADVSGAPASMRYAPPSMYTAASPEQQARWQQASTPAGYRALAATAQMPAQAPAPAQMPAQAPIPGPPPRKPAPPVTATEGPQLVNSPTQPVYDPTTGTVRQVSRLPWAERPTVTGPLNPVIGPGAPPAGGSQSWAGYPWSGRGAGLFGRPGLPSGPAAATAMIPPPPPAWTTAPNITGPRNIMPPAGGSQGWAGMQGLPGVQSDVRVQPFRNLSDTDVNAMGYGDVLRVVGRPDLTDADRAALQMRLTAMTPP